MPIEKRVRYFNGQFLQELDFQVEQEYHIDRQRRHNRTLHTPGIAEGLTVGGAPGDSSVTVAPGTAIDGLGRAIVVESERSANILPAHHSQTVFVVISYRQLETDRGTTGGNDFTRWHEDPLVEIFVETAAPPIETHIRLAKFTVTSSGAIDLPPDASEVERAGVNLEGGVVLPELKLSNSASGEFWPALTSREQNLVNVTGNLQVSGTLSATTTTLADNTVKTAAITNGAVVFDKLQTLRIPETGSRLVKFNRVPKALDIFALPKSSPAFVTLLVHIWTEGDVPSGPSDVIRWSEYVYTTGNEVIRGIRFEQQNQANTVDLMCVFYVLGNVESGNIRIALSPPDPT